MCAEIIMLNRLGTEEEQEQEQERVQKRRRRTAGAYDDYMAAMEDACYEDHYARLMMI